MRRIVTAMVLGLRLIMAHSQSLVGEDVVAPGAQVEKLAGDFQFTEGADLRRGGQPLFHRLAQ